MVYEKCEGTSKFEDFDVESIYHLFNFMLQMGFRDDTSYLNAHYGNSNSRTVSSFLGLASQLQHGPPTERLSDGRQSTSTSRIEQSSQTTVPTAKIINPRHVDPPHERRKIRTHKTQHTELGTDPSDKGCKTIRPTLSDQLASIGKAAECITA